VSEPSTGLAERAAALHWYHTIELAPGVVTAGFFDPRPTVAKVPLPASLDGLRCLDVGTWDGFWAFEMERRGAAEVVALDVEDARRWDWPPQTLIGAAHDHTRELVDQFKSGAASFELAKGALGSNVQRVDVSVYDLDPAVHGSFDVVFMGSLLLHLRDPIGALDRLRTVCARELIVADTVEAISSWLRPRTPTARLEGVDRPWWWQPNRAALERMVQSAGFEVLTRTGIYFLPIGPAHPRPPLRDVLRYPLTTAGREQLLGLWRGIPHAALLGRPAG
jgi:tRNA (mo5U34)-methyltransferase